jgi:hypothetical protein
LLSSWKTGSFSRSAQLHEWVARCIFLITSSVLLITRNCFPGHVSFWGLFYNYQILFHFCPFEYTRFTASSSSHFLFSFFIHQWFYNPLLVPGLFFSCVIFFTQPVGLLGRMISSSQGRYLPTEQHKENKRTQTSMPQLEFEPTIPGFELAKTVHALDWVATMICPLWHILCFSRCFFITVV